jgi:hypothetical protein
MIVILPNLLRGKFVDGKMIAAKKVLVIGFDCDGNGILVSRFSDLDSSSPTFSYDPPNYISFGSTPHLRDPYEAETVEVRESSIDRWQRRRNLCNKEDLGWGGRCF